MRRNIFIPLLFLFFIPACLQAQTDTTVRADTTQTDTTLACQYADTSILFANDTLPEHTKDIGGEIPYLSVINAANVAVPIKLSADKKNWSDFSLTSKGIRLFRCDGVQTLFAIVDPMGKYPYKAVIYRNEKYVVTYNERLSCYQIVPVK